MSKAKRMSTKDIVSTKRMSTKSFSAKVFESEDLVRHIYSFGSDDHRVKMKKISKELRQGFSKVLSQYRPGRGDHKRLGGLTMIETLEQFFMYKRCYCCTAHSYKHNIYMNYTNGRKLIFEEVLAKENYGCPCMCRHNANVMFYTIKYRKS